MYKDVIALAEQCPRLDFIVQPMVEQTWHVQFLSTLLDQIQGSHGGSKTVGIEAIIETPMGLENLREIAGSSPRLEALSFGAGDYAAAMHMKNHVVGWNSREVRAPRQPFLEEHKLLLEKEAGNGSRPHE